MNRLYVNDGVKGKQLCEIILPQSYAENINAIQISLIDQARHIIIGGKFFSISLLHTKC